MQQLLNYLKDLSPNQYKKINAVVNDLGKSYENDVAEFLGKYTPYWISIGLQLEDVIDAYLKMCNQYMYHQIKFYKSGCYPIEKDRNSTLLKINELYRDNFDMKSYMAGLSLSLVLWKSHYLLHEFFIEGIKRQTSNIVQYLEIGTGHGFYFENAYELLSGHSKMGFVEISPVSIEMTCSLMNYFHPDAEFSYVNKNYLDYDHNNGKPDFIVLGEVIEHVEDPGLFLKKSYELLTPDGKVFLSTCVNCPMIDHLFRFTSVDDIRQLINHFGFKIDDELIVPSENLPWDEIVKNKITINYGAILSKS
jgi:SAM-dependent methyltransferase